MITNAQLSCKAGCIQRISIREQKTNFHALHDEVFFNNSFPSNTLKLFSIFQIQTLCYLINFFLVIHVYRISILNFQENDFRFVIIESKVKKTSS